MVAETHSTFEDLTRAQILDFVMCDLLDLVEASAADTLVSLGFDDVLEIAKLAELIGEEYGERTLVGAVLDEIDDTWTLSDLVNALYPDLGD